MINMDRFSFIVDSIEKMVNENGFKLNNEDRLEIIRQYMFYGNVFIEFTDKGFRLYTDKEILKLLEE